MIPGGGAIPDGTSVTIYRLTDLVTPVATVVMAAGRYVHQYDGSYGPIETRVTYNAETRTRESLSIGQAGPINFGDFVFWVAGQGDGVSRGVRNQLAITAGGAGKTVLVRSGAGAAAGIVYNQFTDNKASPTFADNVSGLNRIDLIGYQVWTPGHAQEGRAELAILQGTPAASPVAPTPTQTPENGTWFQPLAAVNLPSAYSSITGPMITDLRTFVFDELVSDALAQMITCGKGLTCTPDDPNNKLIIDQDDPVLAIVTTNFAAVGIGTFNVDAACAGTQVCIGGGFLRPASTSGPGQNETLGTFIIGNSFRCSFRVPPFGTIGTFTCFAHCLNKPV